MDYEFLNNIVELLVCHCSSEDLLEAIQTESDSHIRKGFLSIEDEAHLDKLRDVILNEMQEWHMLERSLYGKRLNMPQNNRQFWLKKSSNSRFSNNV